MQHENLTPALLSDQLKENVISYLKTTFNIKNEGFASAFESHLRSEKGIFRGPFIDIKLPFRSSEEFPKDLLDLDLKIRPFEHQLSAFKRLSSKNKTPQNTIVSTGTGSGKTESFLFPLLDHCARANKSGQRGIKAIVLYPMNALAFDQARRIAELIFSYPELNDKVTAGILVGEDHDSDEKRKTSKVMTVPDRIIDDHSAILKNPPDILLTNYKMLDLLLMKPKFKQLWEGNPQVQYLVLDEMHTYDGAQGADVSFLLRRLKAKIGLDSGDLCCIGTSATLLSGLEGKEILTRFASRLFGEIFTEDAIIGESRLTIYEVFAAIKNFSKNIPLDSADLEYTKDDNLASYINRIRKLWFNMDDEDTLDLGTKILSHKLTQDIFKALSNKTGNVIPKTEDDVINALKDLGYNLTRRQLHSYLSLIAHAQKEIDLGTKKEKVALFQVRIQLWLREIRRTLSSLNYNTPDFKWLDEQSKKIEGKYLPPVFCEECGEVGYLTAVDKHHDFQWDVQKLYEGFAEGKSSVRYLFPWRSIEKVQMDIDEGLSRERAHVCPGCGYYEYEPLNGQTKDNCPSCNTDWHDFRIWSCLSQENKKDKRQCPSCDTRNSLRLLASRTTTLSSIINSQIFLSKLNPRYSKKLLVFSDTVQDASHRAGYYNARTFRFNFRTAIQSFLSKENQELRLLEFGIPFFNYYVKTIGEERTLATLCPSDLSSSQIYEDYFDKKDRKPILDLLKHRIIWELYLEYSLKSQVGRTLEKTLSSAAFVDYQDFKSHLTDLYQRMANENEFVRQASEEKFTKFILGLIERALLRGAIGFNFLTDYRKKESAWELDKKKLPWISRMPKGRLDGSEVGSLPKFISTSKISKIFDFAGAPEQGDGWYSFWLKKHFKNEQLIISRDSMAAFYEEILTSLESLGLFNRVTQGNGNKNFGLNPEKIRISKEILSLSCPECSHKIVVPKHQGKDYEEMGCLITHCHGSYALTEVKQKNYYQAIYESGDIERIFAHEHTGLLSRKVREELEIEFKEKDFAKRRADAINLLSCTPTLEMGIDVGDLSATVVGALPSNAASYQQQVGRAGRKSGSSLVVAIAQARPRDLLYYQYPEELIAGHIEPPGCFVDAPDLLKRQFFAFVFDQAYAEVTKGFEKLKLQIVLDEVQQVSNVGILSNVKNILKDRSGELIKLFKKKFNDSEVSTDTWDELSKEFSPTKLGEVPFVTRLQTVIETFLREKTALDAATAEIRGKIQPFENFESAQQRMDEDQKKEFSELRREKAAIEAQKELLGTKSGLFEFLTRYGFLPNYAFQEDAVELVGLILDEDKDSRGRFTIKHRESFDRPAKVALRELAPLNTFYGGGYKLQIDQIEVGGKVKPLIEEWKLCSSCGYLARQSTEGFESRTCPRCHDGQWGDTSSRTRMLKFQKAVAMESVFSSQVGDEAEDRQKKFFKVRPFFEVPKNAIKNAWGCTDDRFVFGIEFIQRMTMREVNFGADAKNRSETREVIGEELPNGFHICHSCGRVGQVDVDGVEKIKHQATCPYTKKSKSPGDRKQLASEAEPVMLYRELQSEAIRVLLPVSDYEADVRVASIKSALMLGFIKKFGGKPIHLEIAQQIAIEPGEEKMAKRYLVIFDAVPGGTGFLKELWTKESFYDLVNLSLEAMNSCSCKDSTELDGCPRCILAAANQYDLHNVSRKEAIRYLQMIMDHKSKLIEYKNGLDDVEIDSFLDSDLEYRFWGILKRLDSSDIAKRLERFKIKVVSLEKGSNENDALKVTLKNENTGATYNYRVSYQRPLNDGSLKTVADFYFENLTSDRAQNLAVYLDGFKYHAGPNSGDQLTSDFTKRQALINGDGVSSHKVWALTWKDVDSFEKEPADHPAKYFFDLNPPVDHFLRLNPVVQLFKVLTGQEFKLEEFFKIASADGGLIKKATSGVLKDALNIKLDINIESSIANIIRSSSPGKEEMILSHSSCEGRLSVFVSQANKQTTALTSFASHIQQRDSDDFYKEWERLLSTGNVCQLLATDIQFKVWS